MDVNSDRLLVMIDTFPQSVDTMKRWYGREVLFIYIMRVDLHTGWVVLELIVERRWLFDGYDKMRGFGWFIWMWISFADLSPRIS